MMLFVQNKMTESMRMTDQVSLPFEQCKDPDCIKIMGNATTQRAPPASTVVLPIEPTMP